MHRRAAVARQAFQGWPAGLVGLLDAERERWALWLPVGFGIGVTGYFGLSAEPPWWPGVAVLTGIIGAAGLAALAIPLRRGACLVGALVLGVPVCGFVVAQARTAWVAAPMLERKIGPVALRGQVVGIERLPKGLRLLLEHPLIAGLDPDRTPARVRLRLSARQGAAAEIGAWVELRAVLRPPSPPVAPGAFDFQRHAYFQRLGGVGFAVTVARRTAPPGEVQASVFAPWRLALAGLRIEIADRIRAALDGPAGAVAAALMTGDRRAIPAHVLADMRDSGLAHLLAISGLHVGLVAAILFFGLRAALALVPKVALRYPIKKWAAVAALVGAFGYVLISGASVSTQRAFLMVGVVLLAVMVDRTAISMRLVAWAALIVLAMAPESLLGPTFQMSFGAVVALEAAYEVLRRRLSAWRAEAGILRRAGLYLVGVSITTIVATAATAPFAVYHFNRFAEYGLAANLAAVPLTALWVMPWAMAAFCLMPVGLEAVALTPMGWGIEAVIGIARTVAGWPGAVRLVPAMPAAGLALATIGGLWLCLWQGRWRLLGAAAVALGLAGLAVTRPPDILAAADGKLMAVRVADGSLAFSRGRGGRFTRKMWLRRAGQSEPRRWPRQGTSADGALSCDGLACIYRAADRRVALVFDPRALAEDCRAADLVVSLVPVGWACRRQVAAIDRFDLWRHGAHAVWLDRHGGIRIESVADRRGIRPWAPARPRRKREKLRK